MSLNAWLFSREFIGIRNTINFPIPDNVGSDELDDYEVSRYGLTPCTVDTE